MSGNELSELAVGSLLEILEKERLKLRSTFKVNKPMNLGRMTPANINGSQMYIKVE